jgi:hypothetical protein
MIAAVPALVTLGLLASALGGPWLVAIPDPVAQKVLEFGLAMACFVPIAGAARRGPLDPLELGVSVALFYFLLFPVRAVLVLAGLDGFANVRVTHAPSDVIRFSMAVAIWGLMAGGLAYNSGLGVRLARRVRLPTFSSLESPNLWLSAGLFLVGLVSQIVVVQVNHAQGQTDFGPAIESAISEATVLMVVGLSLLTIRVAQVGRGSARVLLSLAVIAGIGVGLIGQFKEPAIITLLTVLITWQFRTRTGVHWRGLLLVVLVVILVIFPLVTVARYTSDRLKTLDPERVISALPTTVQQFALAPLTPLPPGPYRVVTDPFLLVSNRLYGFDSFTLAVRFTPSVLPYQNGQTLTAILVGAVPRAISPDKPSIGIGVWFAIHYWGTGAPGTPVVPQAVGHPGELWINFGIPGVVLGLALLGVWYRFIYVSLNRSRSAVGAVLYSVVFVTVVDVDRDIQLTYVTLIQRLVTTVLILGIIFLFSARRPLQPKFGNGRADPAGP